MWLSLVENLFFSVLNRCAAVQIKQYWDCSTLWINWEGTMCFTLVYNLFLLFSRCAAVQRKQYGECSTLWINREGTMCLA